MQERTSTTIFLGTLFAGLALTAALAAPAFAQTATADVMAQSLALEADNKTICMEAGCLDVPSQPVVRIEFDPSLMDVTPASISTSTRLSQSPAVGIPSLVQETAMPGTSTVIGKVDPDTDSVAYRYLDPNGAGLLDTNDAVRPVDSVTGLGLVSKF